MAGILGAIFLGWLFFDHILGVFLCTPVIFLADRMYEAWEKQRREKRILMEFKECLYALESSLRAGYALENAWQCALEELSELYPEKCLLMDSLAEVRGQMQLNVGLTDALCEWAGTMEQDAIRDFAEVLAITKESGGNMVEMLERNIRAITETMETEEEVRTVLFGKRLEHRIMSGMPVLMMLYLRLTGGTYVEGLYHNAPGVLAVTGCLLISVVAIHWGDRLVRIRV